MRKGHTDDPSYSRSVDTTQNMFPRVEGALVSRPGTSRSAISSSQNGNIQYIPLDPNLENGQIIEVSHGRIAVVQPPSVIGENTGYLVLSGAFDWTETSINAAALVANPSWPNNWTEFDTVSPFHFIGSPKTEWFNGKYDYDRDGNGVGGLSEIYRREWGEGNYTEIYLNIDSQIFEEIDVVQEGRPLAQWLLSGGTWFGYTPDVIDDQVIPEINHIQSTQIVTGTVPYQDDEIVDIRFEVLGDVIHLTHNNHPPAIVFFDSVWKYEVVVFASGPFNPVTEEEKQTTLSVTDFDFRTKIEIVGQDWSGFSTGDFLSLKHEGIYILAEFQFLDGTGAVVKPVKSVLTGLDPAALFELQETTADFLYVGTVAADTLSTETAVFSDNQEGSWIRFKDITATGLGTTVKWAQIGNFLGVDVAQTGFFARGLVNPAEVSVHVLDEIVTTFTEFEHVDSISTEYSGGSLNTTTLTLSNPLFDTSAHADRRLQFVIDNNVINASLLEDSNNTSTKFLATLDNALPYSDDTTPVNQGVANTWRFGAFYTGNNPAAVALTNQRLSYAGTKTHQETTWLSEIDRYFSFSPVNEFNEVLATSSFSVSLGGKKLSPIRWLHSGVQLIIGTEGAIWSITATAGPLTFSTARLDKHSEIGSVLQPVQLGDSLLMAHSSGRQIHEVRFDDSVEGLTVDDGSVVPNHLFQGTGKQIKSLVTQYTPNPYVWALLDDGTLCNLAPKWSRSTRSYGITRHIIGSTAVQTDDSIDDDDGSFVLDELGAALDDITLDGGGDATPRVDAVVALYDADSGREHLYVAVNQGPIRFMERMAFDFDPQSGTDKDDMLYLDSALTAEDSTPKTVWTDFSDYIGNRVTVVADGLVVLENILLTSGTITLIKEASRVTMGYSMTANARLLPFTTTHVHGNNGTQGIRKRITGVSVRLHRTLGISAGPTLDNLIVENFENNDDIMNGTDLFSGDVEVKFHQNRTRGPQFYIQQTKPYPLNILSVTAYSDT